MPGDVDAPIRDYIQRVVGGGTPARGITAFWDGNIPWASVKDFTDGMFTLLDTQEHVSDKGVAASATNVIPANTPIICTRMAVGRAALTSRPTAINQDVKALFPNQNLDPRFLVHLLALKRPQLEAVAIGSTVKGITLPSLLNLRWHPLPLPEQRRIAEILDILDRTIEGTQRVVEKLQAARQGLLHDLLTRGLDEQNQLRDSERHPDQFHETELGRLPVGWEVAPLSSFAVPGVPHIKTGPFGSALKGEHWTEGGVPVITIGALGEGSFLLEELLYVSDKTAKRLNAYRVEPGHLVFSRVADVGRSVVVEKGESGWLMSSNLMRLSLDTHAVEPHYFQAVLSSSINLRAQIRRAVNAGGRDVANTAILNSLKLAWPTLDEQRRIVATIHGREARLRAETTTLVKLQALKRGLMDDLLTGRVRVQVAKSPTRAVVEPVAPANVPFPPPPVPLAQAVHFRATQGADPASQTNWVEGVRRLAQRQSVGAYSRDALAEAVKELAELSLHPEGILSVPDVLKRAGVRFVVLKHPKGSKTSGAAFWLDAEAKVQPVVALSMRYPLLDVFWFNLLHELGHIWHGHAAVLGEELAAYRDDSQAEREANAFAREALIREAVWQPYLTSGNHTSRGLRTLARKLGRHHATVAGRLAHDLDDYQRFGSRELRPQVPQDIFERLVLRLGGDV